MRKLNYKDSFENWCIENNREDFLDLWDYETTGFSPSDIMFSSKKKAYFKCSKNPLHPSTERVIRTLTDKEGRTIKCKRCNSLGQYIVDNFGEEFLEQIWSDKNTKSPYEYSHMGRQSVWFRCIEGIHDDFERLITNAVQADFSCSKCSLENLPSRQKMDLIGMQFGELTVVKYDKKKSLETGKNYWYCKCTCGDMTSACIGALRSGQKTCGNRGFHQRGENNPGWKGGVSAANHDLRKNADYYYWRRKCLEADDYKCQCCGSSDELEVHHIRSFLDHEDMRTDVANGVVLCKNHHSTSRIGSFHNEYGVKIFSENDLEKYINKKRKELGIFIPFSIDDYIRNKKISNLSNWIDKLNTYEPDPDWKEPLNYEGGE